MRSGVDANNGCSGGSGDSATGADSAVFGIGELEEKSGDLVGGTGATLSTVVIEAATGKCNGGGAAPILALVEGDSVVVE